MFTHSSCPSVSVNNDRLEYSKSNNFLARKAAPLEETGAKAPVRLRVPLIHTVVKGILTGSSSFDRSPNGSAAWREASRLVSIVFSGAGFGHELQSLINKSTTFVVCVLHLASMIPDTSTPSAAESTPSLTLLSLSASFPPVAQPKSAVAKLVLRPHPPIRVPPDVATWNRVQQIEEIEVLPVRGSPDQEPQYAIRVRLRHSHSRTTTIYNRACDIAADKPELLVLRRFAEFETLRTQVWDAVRHPHHLFCELCDGLTQLMLTKMMGSTVLTKTIYRSQASRAKKMRKFLLRVLSELRENKPLCVSMCRGQHELPLVLHGFLFHNEEAEAACAAAATTSESTALRS